MKTFVVFLIFLAGAFALYFGIRQFLSSVPTEGQQRNEYFHFIVLLDLSNRIDPKKNPHQGERDQEVLRVLIELFREVARRHEYYFSKDKLSIIVAPQPTDYGLGNTDRLLWDTDGFQGTIQKFIKRQTEMESAISDLYARAMDSSHFVGADIWAFVRDSLSDYLIQSSETEVYHNVLIIITDGYLNFDKGVEDDRPRNGNRTSFMNVAQFRSDTDLTTFDAEDHGLIAFPLDLRAIKQILFLEIAPKDVRDYPILRKYWVKFFSEMGVSQSTIVLKTAGEARNHLHTVIRNRIFSL